MQNCGECTLCCTLLELHEVPSAIGETCRHCTNTGCAIQQTKPKECKEYQCMWSQMPDQFATLAMRPDNCGIIFDRQGDDVIAARMEEGKKLNDLLIGQINSFNKQGFSVLVFRGKDCKHFLIEGHTEQYVEELIRGRGELYN